MTAASLSRLHSWRRSLLNSIIHKAPSRFSCVIPRTSCEHIRVQSTEKVEKKSTMSQEERELLEELANVVSRRNGNKSQLADVLRRAADLCEEGMRNEATSVGEEEALEEEGSSGCEPGMKGMLINISHVQNVVAC